jgi:hypothetical protein
MSSKDHRHIAEIGSVHHLHMAPSRMVSTPASVRGAVARVGF